MAGGPGGKSVGKVSIRVVPNTEFFKKELEALLETIEKRVKFTVTVNKVRLDRVAIKESLQKQFDRYDGFKVKVAVDLVKAKHDIDKFVDDTNKKDATININAATAAATAQMRFLTRDRFVTIYPRLNGAAMKRVTAQLLALTGARVGFEWGRDILEFIENLDRKLPALSLIISSIGALVGVLLSATSGLLGIGSGLAAIAPLFLILPGMILGTAVAVTAFAIAMAEASKELAPLEDEMQELADLIQSGFWDAARDPIIHLVNTLMPQLREAFDLVSRSLGRFTARFAEAFEKQLAGGKLRELFKGIADSFDILATGTDAFAGAIVSLSAVAAKYAPRFSQWFVDISIQFDNWLREVAEDGRLDQWMEDGIRAVKDLGRAVRGTARIFSGLWKAAEAAGGKGLKGFADNLEHIADVIHGPRFQEGMTAWFRGAQKGAESVGQGINKLGDLFYDLRDDFEFVLQRLGDAFGRLLGGIADALNQPIVGQGMRDFVNGLNGAVIELNKYLPTIAQGFAGILTFAGQLVETIGRVLGAGGAVLAEVIQPWLDAAGKITDTLGKDLQKAFDDLGPDLKDASANLASIVASLVTLATSDVIPQITSILQPLLAAFNRGTKAEEPTNWNVADLLGEWGRFFAEAPHIISDMLQGDPQLVLIDALQGKYGVLWDQINRTIYDIGTKLDNGWKQIVGFFNDLQEAFTHGNEQWAEGWNTFSTTISDGWNQSMTAWGNGWNQIVGAWNAVVEWYNGTVIPAWNGFWSGLGTAVTNGWNGVVTAFQNGWNQIVTFFAGLNQSFWNVGVSIVTGIIGGVNSMINSAVAAVKKVGGDMLASIKKFLGIASPSTLFRDEIGKQITAGIVEGIEAGTPAIDAALAASVAMPTLNAFAPGLPSIDGGLGSTYNAAFNLTPDPGIPLADQVFQASQRLKARTLVRSVA